MAISGGLLATCGVPPLAAPHATCSPAFISFFTGGLKAVRSAPRPHRLRLRPARTEITCGHCVRRIFADLFGQNITDDSGPLTVNRRETVFDSFARSGRPRTSQLNRPSFSHDSETPRPETGQRQGSCCWPRAQDGPFRVYSSTDGGRFSLSHPTQAAPEASPRRVGEGRAFAAPPSSRRSGRFSAFASGFGAIAS